MYELPDNELKVEISITQPGSSLMKNLSLLQKWYVIDSQTAKDIIQMQTRCCPIL